MHEVYVLRPRLDILEVYKVNGEEKGHELFKNDTIRQFLDNLVLTTEINEKGENWTSTSTVIHTLEVGDLLVFGGENNGYLSDKKLNICTVKEAIEDFDTIKDLEVRM